MPDFIVEEYSDLIQGFIDAGFFISQFSEIEQNLSGESPFLLLRHDVDIDLRAALEMARVENRMNVKSTYFVCLRSPFYNPLSSFNSNILEEIHALGHNIAAHLDLKIHNNDFLKARKEIETLQHFYPFVDGGIISLHHPGNINELIGNIQSLPTEIDTLYGPILRGNIEYISDSTGQWRFGHPYNSKAYLERKPLQLLTHPIWWTEERYRPPEVHLAKWIEQHMIVVSSAAREFLPKLLLSGSEK